MSEAPIVPRKKPVCAAGAAYGSMGSRGGRIGTAHVMAKGADNALCLDRDWLDGGEDRCSSVGEPRPRGCGEASWLLMELAVLSAISTLSSAPMICCTGRRKSLGIISGLFIVGESSGQVAVAIHGRL